MDDIMMIWFFVGALLWTALVIFITTIIVLQHRRPIHEVVEVKEVVRYPSEMIVLKKDIAFDEYDLRRFPDLMKNTIKNEAMMLVEDHPHILEVYRWDHSHLDHPGKQFVTIKLRIMPPKK